MIAAIDGIRRSRRHHALRLRRRRDAGAALQRQFVRLARRLLCGHLVDPRRLDAALQRGPLYGRRGWGDHDRKTNPFYAPLRAILQLAPDGQVHVNRDLANWPRDFAKPYTKDLIRILGEPIALKDMWNPDAMLRVEDIRHKETPRNGSIRPPPPRWCSRMR